MNYFTSYFYTVISLSFIITNSKKKAEDEAEWEVQERCKSRCIWLTGQKGLTEYDAAVLIIQEAKELLASDLFQLGVDWKPAGTAFDYIISTVFCQPIESHVVGVKSVVNHYQSKHKTHVSRLFFSSKFI